MEWIILAILGLWALGAWLWLRKNGKNACTGCCEGCSKCVKK